MTREQRAAWAEWRKGTKAPEPADPLRRVFRSPGRTGGVGAALAAVSGIRMRDGAPMVLVSDGSLRHQYGRTLGRKAARRARKKANRAAR